MGASCSSTSKDDAQDDFKCADVAAHDDRQPPPRPSISMSSRPPRSDSPHLTSSVASRSLSRSRSISKGPDGRRRLHKQGPPPAGTGHVVRSSSEQRCRSRSVASDGSISQRSRPRAQRRVSQSEGVGSGSSGNARSLKSTRSPPSDGLVPPRRGRSTSTSHTDSAVIRTNHLHAAFPDSAIPPRPNNPNPYTKRSASLTADVPRPRVGDGSEERHNTVTAPREHRVANRSPSPLMSVGRPKLEDVRHRPILVAAPQSSQLAALDHVNIQSHNVQVTTESDLSALPSEKATGIEKFMTKDDGHIAPSLAPTASPVAGTVQAVALNVVPLSPATPESPTQPDLALRALPSRPRKKSSPSKSSTFPSITAIAALSNSPPQAAFSFSASEADQRPYTSVSQATAAALAASPPFPPPVRLQPHEPAWPFQHTANSAPMAYRQRPSPLPLGTIKSHTVDVLTPSSVLGSDSSRHSIRSSTSSIYTDSGAEFSPDTPGPTLTSFPSISAFPQPGGFGMQTAPPSWDRHASPLRQKSQLEEDPDMADLSSQRYDSASWMVRGLHTPPATKTGFGFGSWDHETGVSVPILLDGPARSHGVVDERMRKMGIAMLRGAHQTRGEAWT